MDDPLAVGIGDRVRDREHVRQQREAFLERRRLRHDIAQRSSRDELHRIERLAARPSTDLVNGYDRRVLKARREERLTTEATPHARAQLARLLDGHHAIQPPVARAQEPAVSAARELLANLVVVPRDDRKIPVERQARAQTTNRR